MSTPTQQKDQRQFAHAYYQSLFGRNVINTNVLPVVLIWICFPKLVLEVFTRRKMGERYFSKVWAVLLAITLYFVPDLTNAMFHWQDTFIYYTFFTAYVIMALYCCIEIRRAPSVFDFARFSLDPGKSLPLFRRIKIFGKTPSQRTIDVYLEPLFCFVIGLLLVLLSQPTTGVVIVFCSLCYFISNYSFAVRGDHVVMDIIDDGICGEDFAETFAQGEDISPRGVPIYAQKPTTKELREKFTASLSHDDEDAAVAM